MRISVLINNHNYGRYLGEAVESASLQVLAPHEVIVVDDGSTDDSRSIVDSMQRKNPALVSHRQENMGQLAALRAGAERASGEWCALLDSDDTWTSRHLDVLRESRNRHPDIGIYFAGHTETEGPPLYRTVWPPVPLGPVPAFVAATGFRFGSITSAICLRTELLREIVAATRPLEAEWRTRADDVIIYGAALNATRLFHSDTPTVRYRIHGANSFAGKNTRAVQNDHRLRRERVINVLQMRYGITKNNLIPLLLAEWRCQRATAPKALRKRYRRGLRKKSLRAWLAGFF